MVKYYNINEQEETARKHLLKLSYFKEISEQFFNDLTNRLKLLGYEKIKIEIGSKNTGIRKTFKTAAGIYADNKVFLYNINLLTSCSKAGKMACVLDFGKTDWYGICLGVSGRALSYDFTDLTKEYKDIEKLKIQNKSDYEKAMKYILIPFETFQLNPFNPHNDKTGEEDTEVYLTNVLSVLRNELKKDSIKQAGKKFS